MHSLDHGDSEYDLQGSPGRP